MKIPALMVFAFLSLLLVANLGATEINSRYNEPYPRAVSKKGLQVELVDDALALGIKHAALNLNLSDLVAPTGGGDTEVYQRGSNSFQFHRGYLRSMDARVKELSDAGVLVNLIVLCYESARPEVNRLMLHPGYATNAPNHLGAFNTGRPEGAEWFTACLEFLAERWSRPDRKYGRAVGYIIGNEVNSHWWWSNMGRVSLETFTEDYVHTLRLAHNAVRGQCSWARIYVSLDHYWNMRCPDGDPSQGFPGREFLDLLARRSKELGDFDWHVAYHPYPENLFQPAFWKDTTATTNAGTPRITFKNLEMLLVYLRQPALLCRGQTRRVILSEQGFHTPAGEQGEILQAAAYCYAYKKVEALEGIDAFILHRHVDHDHEGGLLLGLRRNKPANGDPRPRKRIYECFRAADTAQWEEVFAFALPIIGLQTWEAAKPTGR